MRKVRKKIGKYYEENKVPAPPKIHKREFGAGNKEKIDYRHRSFKNEDELNKFLVSEKPRFISYSAAYYNYPSERPMKRKQYQKGDLVFEFDAECSHDTLTCYQCLEETKQETQKLVKEFLVKDFGYDEQYISIYFSGNRGYHIHVRDPKALGLSAEARREIVDYVQANNLKTPNFKENGPKPDEEGWRGKIARQIYKFVEQSNREKMKELNINNRKIKHLINNRKEILKSIKDGEYDTLPGPETLWEKVLKDQVIDLTAKIDHQVTMDTSRLMRVPETIHGGSSLIATEIKNLDEFHPFKHPVAFGEKEHEIKITKNTPKIHLKGEPHGPYEKGQQLKVPEYLAMFLACKQHAKPKW